MTELFIPLKGREWLKMRIGGRKDKGRESSAKRKKHCYLDERHTKKRTERKQIRWMDRRANESKRCEKS